MYLFSLSHRFIFFVFSTFKTFYFSSSFKQDLPQNFKLLLLFSLHFYSLTNLLTRRLTPCLVYGPNWGVGMASSGSSWSALNHGFFISGFLVRRIIFTCKYTTNNDLKEAFFYLQDWERIEPILRKKASLQSKNKSPSLESNPSSKKYKRKSYLHDQEKTTDTMR